MKSICIGVIDLKEKIIRNEAFVVMYRFGALEDAEGCLAEELVSINKETVK